MKRGLLIAGGALGGLGAVMAITPPQFSSTESLAIGGDGVVLPQVIGGEVAALFTGAPVTLKIYRNAGHLPMLEQPDASVRDAVEFLRAAGSGP